MRKGWLIVNEFLKSKKFSELAELFVAAAQKENMELSVYTNAHVYELLPPLGTLSYLDKNIWIKSCSKPDFVIFWDKDILLAQFLEQLEIPVYNNSKCIAICDDKRKTHQSLWKADIPMPATIFAPMTYDSIGFTNYDFLTSAEKKLGYPMIVKEAFGSFGEQVYLASNREELQQLLEHKISSHEILFQEYIEESKGRDVRLQVVGDRVVAAMYRYSEKDFRANITAGGHMKAYSPTKEEKELAIAAAKAVNADFAGVDLLFSKGNHSLVCEVNSNAHFKNLMDCTDVNVAEKICSYIKSQQLPWGFLVYDEEGARRNRDYIEMHMKKAEEYSLSLHLVMVSELEEKVKHRKPDFVIFRSICPEWTKKLENMGIPVFNNSKVSEICNDKGKTIEYIRQQTKGTVTTLPTRRFPAEELTDNFLAKHPDCVVKAVAGHGGTQVFSTDEPLEKIRTGMKGQDFILQPFYKNSEDIRVYVIGKKIVAAVKRTPKKGFKSNFSLGGRVEPFELSETQQNIVELVLDAFDFGLAGIDFFCYGNEFVLNEIEDVVGARMLYQCFPDVDLLGQYFSFILDKMLH